MKSRDGVAKVYLTPAGTYKVRFYCQEHKERNKNCTTKTERDALVRAIKKQAELDYCYRSRPTPVEGHSVACMLAQS
jgi:hypothetical protein